MSLKIRWRRIRYKVIFPSQLSVGIFFLRLFGNKKRCKALMLRVSECAEGTVGIALWQFLQKNKIEFVPWYELHDLKHIVLGFKPIPPEETRMQAFMFGNAGFSLFSTFTFFIFVIWTPEMWDEIPIYYRLGKMAKPMSNYKMEEILDFDLEAFRKSLELKSFFEYRRTGRNPLNSFKEKKFDHSL